MLNLFAGKQVSSFKLKKDFLLTKEPVPCWIIGYLYFSIEGEIKRVPV